MKSENLAQKDKEYIWHPFTQMASWLDDTPLVIASGEGPYLIDTEGNRYLDGISSLWTNVHGHQVKAIDDAVKKQLDQISHSTLLGLGNVPSIEFAEKLAPYLPGDLKRIFYSDNGATSVEVALKLAFSHYHHLGNTNKKTFIRFEGAYHGDTIGSVSVGGIDAFHSLFSPLLFKAPVAPYPFCYRCPFEKDKKTCNKECFEAVEQVVKENATEAAGIVIEPLVQGASGIRPAPSGFLKFLRTLCDKYDLLLIVDEVATGFGKTGKMFASEHEGVVPDLMAMAKGISGGYLPLAATAVSEKVFQSFLKGPELSPTFFHGHTYTGNPLACAAGIASLEVFEQEQVLHKVSEVIKTIDDRLTRLKQLDHVGNVRHVGVMTGIELVEDKEAKKSFAQERLVGARICKSLRKKQIILRPLGDVLVIMPPLCISTGQIEMIFDALEAVISNIQ